LPGFSIPPRRIFLPRELIGKQSPAQRQNRRRGKKANSANSGRQGMGQDETDAGPEVASGDQKPDSGGEGWVPRR